MVQMPYVEGRHALGRLGRTSVAFGLRDGGRSRVVLCGCEDELKTWRLARGVESEVELGFAIL